MCLEHKHFVPHTDADFPPDITPKMRTILVEWIIDVVNKVCSFGYDTIHLAMTLADEYIFAHPETSRIDYQAIGVTALLITSKMVEVNILTVKDLSWLTDNSVSAEKILELEKSMAELLQMNFIRATAQSFIHRVVDQHNLTPYTKHFIDALGLIMLREGMTYRYKPSEIAAGAYYLATDNSILIRPEFGTVLELFKEEEIKKKSSILRFYRKLVKNIEPEAKVPPLDLRAILPEDCSPTKRLPHRAKYPRGVALGSEIQHSREAACSS
jgi:Cyclin, N-terminal domain